MAYRPTETTTHEVTNQAPPIVPYNVFEADVSPPWKEPSSPSDFSV